MRMYNLLLLGVKFAERVGPWGFKSTPFNANHCPCPGRGWGDPTNRFPGACVLPPVSGFASGLTKSLAQNRLA